MGCSLSAMRHVVSVSVHNNLPALTDEVMAADYAGLIADCLVA